MYELLRTAVEVLAKAMASLASHRKDDRLQALGVELFALLAAAYEIVNRGEQIVVLLRETEPMAVAQSTTPDPKTVQHWQTHLIAELRDQFEAMYEYNNQASKLGRLMHIISPEEFDRFTFQIWQKIFRLSRFDSMIGTAFEGSEEIDLGVRMRRVSERHIRDGGGVSWAWSETIEALAEIPQATVAAIGTYLEQARPEEQLASMRESLAIVRSALAEHFSLTDILLGLQARAPRRRDGIRVVQRMYDRHDQ